MQGLQQDIAAVTVDVNAFLATFGNPSEVLDIRYYTGHATKYGHYMMHSATVIYLENV